MHVCMYIVRVSSFCTDFDNKVKDTPVKLYWNFIYYSDRVQTFKLFDYTV